MAKWVGTRGGSDEELKELKCRRNRGKWKEVQIG